MFVTSAVERIVVRMQTLERRCGIPGVNYRRV
jgi:hypothetical protein